MRVRGQVWTKGEDRGQNWAEVQGSGVKFFGPREETTQSEVFKVESQVWIEVRNCAAGCLTVMTCPSGWNYAIRKSNSSCCPSPLTRCMFEGVVTLEYMIYFNFLSCVLLPLLIMMAIYAHMFMAARRQLRLMGPKVTQPHRTSGREGTAQVPTLPGFSRLRAELNAARSLALLVGVFALCWLPLHLLNSYHQLCQGCSRSPDALMSAAIVLSHANSALNPIIYACRLPEFRFTFSKILGQKLLCYRRRQGAVRPCESAGITSSSSHVSQEGLSCISVVDGVLDQTEVGSASPWGPAAGKLPQCIVGLDVERVGAGTRGGGVGLQ